MGLPGTAGRVTPAQVRAATATVEDVVDQRPAVLVIENTHNVAGGRVWPLADLDDVSWPPAPAVSACTSTGRGC